MEAVPQEKGVEAAGKPTWPEGTVGGGSFGEKSRSNSHQKPTGTPATRSLSRVNPYYWSSVMSREAGSTGTSCALVEDLVDVMVKEYLADPPPPKPSVSTPGELAT